jgi:hypothetical protein
MIKQQEIDVVNNIDHQEAESIKYGNHKVFLVRLSSGNIAVYDTFFSLAGVIEGSTTLDEIVPGAKTEPRKRKKL